MSADVMVRDVGKTQATPNATARDMPPTDYSAVEWLAWRPDGMRVAAALSMPSDGPETRSSIGIVRILDPRSREWGVELKAQPSLHDSCLAWSQEGFQLA